MRECEEVGKLIAGGVFRREGMFRRHKESVYCHTQHSAKFSWV